MTTRHRMSRWLPIISTVACLLAGTIAAQSITGRVTNGAEGLDGKIVTAQVLTAIGIDTTRNGGLFTINTFINRVSPAPNVTASFSLSVPYPQPASNSATVEMNIPQRARVHLTLTNILGQIVTELMDQSLEAGMYRIGVRLKGLAKGVYFLTANDGNHIWTDKLLHLGKYEALTPFVEGIHRIGGAMPSSPKQVLNKATDQQLSLSVSGRSILKKTQTYILAGSTLDVGDIKVDSAWNVDVETISTIRYNQPNNQIAAVSIDVDGYTAVTDAPGIASVQVPKTDAVRNMDISDPSIWLRQKKIHVNKDTTTIEDILTKTEFPDSVMNYLDYVSQRDTLYNSDVLQRFIAPPIFYIVGDTTQEFDKEFYTYINELIRGTINDVTKSIKYPQGFLNNTQIITGQNPPTAGTSGYYVITTSNQYGNAAALTNDYADLEQIPPCLISAQTTFGTNPQPNMTQIKRLAGHELASGIVYMPNRSDALGSWYNWGPPIEHSNPSITDTLMLKYIFSRETGVGVVDADYDRYRELHPIH